MKNILFGLILTSVIAGAAGCAGGGGSPPPPPTVDVTGNWVGTWMPTNPSLVGGGMIQMMLRQEESQYTGTLLVTGAGSPGFNGFTQGVVSGNQIRVMIPANWAGNFVVEGDTMRGMIITGGFPTVGFPVGGPLMFGAAGTSPLDVTLTRQR